jgi:hypothetical protein
MCKNLLGIAFLFFTSFAFAQTTKIAFGSCGHQTQRYKWKFGTSTTKRV